MAKTKAKTVSLTNLILLALEKGVQAGELFFESMDDMKRWIYEVYGDYPKPINNYSLSQAIRRLRQKGLLDEERREEGALVLRLTDEGKEIVLLMRDDKEWDGKWRIVIFDIPERQRLVRNTLRRRLKSWGFQSWQKSVWATKKNITNKLREFIKELEIDKWVIVVESDNVGF